MWLTEFIICIQQITSRQIFHAGLTSPGTHAHVHARTPSHRHTHTHTRKRTNTQSHTDTYTHTHIYTNMHTYTHTHTLTLIYRSWLRCVTALTLPPRVALFLLHVACVLRCARPLRSTSAQRKLSCGRCLRSTLQQRSSSTWCVCVSVYLGRVKGTFVGMCSIINRAVQ